MFLSHPKHQAGLWNSSIPGMDIPVLPEMASFTEVKEIFKAISLQDYRAQEQRGSHHAQSLDLAGNETPGTTNPENLETCCSLRSQTTQGSFQEIPLYNAPIKAEHSSVLESLPRLEPGTGVAPPAQTGTGTSCTSASCADAQRAPEASLLHSSN